MSRKRQAIIKIVQDGRLHDRVFETERKLCRLLGEQNQTWEAECERSQYVMDMICLMMQSNDTKTMNFDKYVEEVLNNPKQTGWNGSTRTTRFWAEEDHDP